MAIELERGREGGREGGSEGEGQRERERVREGGGGEREALQTIKK